MIGRLRGTLVWKRAPVLMVDVGGVGYEVEAPMTTFYALPESGSDVTLHTHLVVREDAQLLYGFAAESERSFFRDLIKVNGVGAKMGLTILSGMSAESFAQAVRSDDVASLVRLPGVGKKTAERLIIEMRDRISDGFGDASVSQNASAEAGVAANNPINDAVSALVALGYKPQEASRMIRGVDCDGLASEEIIRHALKTAAG
jgi:Holliday junction DNA helicase RuvA